MQNHKNAQESMQNIIFIKVCSKSMEILRDNIARHIEIRKWIRYCFILIIFLRVLFLSKFALSRIAIQRNNANRYIEIRKWVRYYFILMIFLWSEINFFSKIVESICTHLIQILFFQNMTLFWRFCDFSLSKHLLLFHETF